MVEGNSYRRSFLMRSGAAVAGLGFAGCTEQPNSQNEDPDVATSTEEPPDFSEIAPEDSGLDLEYLHGITGQTYPSDVDADGFYRRRYEWDAMEYEWWIELDIAKRLEDYYDKRFGRSSNYDMYVSDAYSDPYIKDLADGLKQMGDNNNFSEREIVDLSVAFVQALKYTKDLVTTGYNQYTFYPAETLIENGGDCEDSTILLAAILREMGYDCVLILLPDADPAHMALGVKGDQSIPGTYYEFDGNRYYYVETTGEGWRIGQMPEFSGSTQADVVEINNYPTLLYYYETQVEQDGRVSVEVRIFNKGELAANKNTFYAKLENQFQQVVANDQVQFGTVVSGHEINKTLTLEPPEATKLRMSTEIETGNSIQARHRSEWRSPV
jgi:hypothetical protein